MSTAIAGEKSDSREVRGKELQLRLRTCGIVSQGRNTNIRYVNVQIIGLGVD